MGGLIGAAIALIGSSLISVQNVSAATVEEFHAQRFGQGGWTYKEMLQVARDNNGTADLSKYARKLPDGGTVWENIPPEEQYKDPVLGQQIESAMAEAQRWRKTHNVDVIELTHSMTAGESMTSKELADK